MNPSTVFHQRMNRMLDGASGLGRLIIFVFVWGALTLVLGGTVAVFAVAEVRPFVLPIAAIVVYVYLARFFNRQR